MNIGGWLRNLGLERYELLFIENAIDSDVLAELTEGDLEKLGIPLGDRSASLRLFGRCSPTLPLRSRAELERMRKAGNPTWRLPSADTSP